MTVREKLKELHEEIQTAYGFGEGFFRGQLAYRIGLIKKIIVAYGEFAGLQYHVDKEYLGVVNAAYANIETLQQKKYDTGFNVQNNYLNMLKSNMSQAYWLFSNLVEGKCDGFFDKPFDEYEPIG